MHIIIEQDSKGVKINKIAEIQAWKVLENWLGNESELNAQGKWQSIARLNT